MEVDDTAGRGEAGNCEENGNCDFHLELQDMLDLCQQFVCSVVDSELGKQQALTKRVSLKNRSITPLNREKDLRDSRGHSAPLDTSSEDAAAAKLHASAKARLKAAELASLKAGAGTLKDGTVLVLDANGDGYISREEFQQVFDSLDINKDGYVDRREFASAHGVPFAGRDKDKNNLLTAAEFEAGVRLSLPRTSYRTEASDPAKVSLVSKKGGARANFWERVADSGVLLSKQFEPLLLRTHVLRGEITMLDHFNADPMKIGSRAWRMALNETNMQCHLLESRTLKSPKSNRQLPPLSPPTTRNPPPRASGSPGISHRSRAESISPTSPKGIKSPNISPNRITSSTSRKRSKSPIAGNGTVETKDSNDPATLQTSVIRIQRRWRGALQRIRFAAHYKKITMAWHMVHHFNLLKMSEINALYSTISCRDHLRSFLNMATKHMQDVIDFLDQNESNTLAKMENDVQKQILLLQEQQEAAREELFEADICEKQMKLEQAEMYLFKNRLDRGQETYHEMKVAAGIIEGSDKDNAEYFRETLPSLYKALVRVNRLTERYKKETQEYEYAMVKCAKERQEANDAIHEADEVQAHLQFEQQRAADQRKYLTPRLKQQKLADPRVSLTQRFRALANTESYVMEREIMSAAGSRPKSTGKQTESPSQNYGGVPIIEERFCAVHIIEESSKIMTMRNDRGIIQGTFTEGVNSSYAGDMVVVESIEESILREAFDLVKRKEVESFHYDGLLEAGFVQAMDLMGRLLNGSEVARCKHLAELLKCPNMNAHLKCLKAFKSQDTLKKSGTLNFQDFSQVFLWRAGLELPEGLGVETIALPSFPNHSVATYEGQIVDDKRHGVGRYTHCNGHWYLGQWAQGIRHGKGIEGLLNAQFLPVPVAVVKCKHGVRTEVTRFHSKTNQHIALLRRMCTIVELAQKRAAKAHRLLKPVIDNHQDAHRKARRLFQPVLEKHRSKSPVGEESH